MKGLRWLGIFCLFITAAALADEQVRQVQEELRKRNLYFGDIDGQMTPELSNALKRYQSRKGFAPSGNIDAVTATSLNVQAPRATATAQSQLPDVPVLRSDIARELPQQERAALEQRAEENPDAIPSPPSPAESPPPAAQAADPQRIHALVEQYLRDSETSDIAAQTRYFAYPVEYFDHGAVGPAFVKQDVTNYVKRWPERKYVLQEPVTITAAPNDTDVVVQFPITFDVRNQKHTAHGRTQNFWTLRPEGGELKIVSIREQRLRE